MDLFALAGVVGLLTAGTLLRRHRCTWCGAPLHARDLADHFLAAHVHEPAPVEQLQAKVA